MVFLRSTAQFSHAASEGHRRWSQGLLYDNHVELAPNHHRVLGLYKIAVTSGAVTVGAAVHSVAWNGDMAGETLVVQKPPTAQNYAIGCSGNVTGVGPFAQPAGHIEGTGRPGLKPPSLFHAQLADRLGIHAAEGRLSFLRVHDAGTKFGPPGDQLDVEVVVRLDTRADMAFGFQLRPDSSEATRKGMLDTLRTAFKRDRRCAARLLTDGPYHWRHHPRCESFVAELDHSRVTRRGAARSYDSFAARLDLRQATLAHGRRTRSWHSCTASIATRLCRRQVRGCIRRSCRFQ